MDCCEAVARLTPDEHAIWQRTRCGRPHNLDLGKLTVTYNDNDSHVSVGTRHIIIFSVLGVSGRAGPDLCFASLEINHCLLLGCESEMCVHEWSLACSPRRFSLCRE
jgi:hypothetical protein